MVATACAKCNAMGIDFPWCNRCKTVRYCGVTCQRADWSFHKVKCMLPISEVMEKIDQALDVKDWRKVISFEARMEEIIAQDNCKVWNMSSANKALRAFASGREQGFTSTGKVEHLDVAIRLEKRRAELASARGEFMDQGSAICSAAHSLKNLSRQGEAEEYFKKALSIGKNNLLSTVSCDACTGLGELYMMTARPREGMTMLMDAMQFTHALKLVNPTANARYEWNVLARMLPALFQTNCTPMDAFYAGGPSALEHAALLIPQFYNLATQKSREEGGLCPGELQSLCYKALLHEVKPHIPSQGHILRFIDTGSCPAFY